MGMRDEDKTKKQLIVEIAELRRQNAKLEASDAEREKVEKEASYKQDMMQTLLNNIPDYIYFKDRNRRFVLASNSFCDLFKCSLDDIIGQKDEDLFPEEVAEETSNDDRRVIETGIPIINKTEGGESIGDEEHWVLTTKIPWYDREGNIIGLFGISKEITDHRNALEALRKSEIRFRSLVEQTTDAVFCYEYNPPIPIDLPINEQVELLYDGTLAECNDVCARTYGVSKPEEVVGKKLTELFGTKPGSLNKLFTDIIEGNYHIVDGLGTEILPDGSKRYYLNNGTGVIKGDKLIRIWGTFRDITEKKQLEERLQRAQKMEAIGTLAGGVAHDLNSVLAGIVSYPDLLLMQLPQDSPFRNPIVTIKESGKKAAAIVQDLLTLARRGVAISEVVNLNTIIEKYLRSLEFEKLKSFHPIIKVETDFEADLLNVLGSPIHLSSTVMNLVSNAAESMIEEGKLSISTKNQYIDEPIHGYDNVVEGDYVVLVVSDTGTGMSPEDMERIFEPFYTKKKMGRSGTGLGMAVVWSTVKDHRGYIDIQSTIGKGTTFFLYFPATRQKSTNDQIKSSIEDYKGKGESILVVDDAKEQRDIAFMILTELGYHVTTVSSGEDAIKHLYKNSVDLVIIDMVMDPGLDGLDTYKQILNLNPFQKVIIESGFSTTDRVKEAQRLGAVHYIKKPYTIKTIGKAIRDELGKKK